MTETAVQGATPTESYGNFGLRVLFTASWVVAEHLGDSGGVVAQGVAEDERGANSAVPR